MALQKLIVLRTPGKLAFSGVSLVLASLQAACMTSSTDPICSAEGVQYVPGASDGDAVCARFLARMHSRLDGEPDRAGLAVALTIGKNGTISAAITEPNSQRTQPFPEVAVDVMDRPLNYSDLDQLADATAAMLNEQ